MSKPINPSQLTEPQIDALQSASIAAYKIIHKVSFLNVSLEAIFADTEAISINECNGLSLIFNDILDCCEKITMAIDLERRTRNAREAAE